MAEWVQQAASFGVSLTAVQQEQFRRYETLLLTWNERMNLTALRTPALVQQYHFLDSLTCVSVMGDLNGRTLIDVGTGAGFPGVPLKIVYPQMQLVLVESVKKKTRFLHALMDELQLKNVHIAPDRAESLARQPAHRARYDWAVARAVADMRVLAEYLLPFCHVGGAMLAQKGSSAPVETDAAAAAIRTLGGGEPRLHPVQLPDDDDNRYLVVVPKVGETPSKYPRRVGVPAKRPLSQ